jgi:hypothetical protein
MNTSETKKIVSHSIGLEPVLKLHNLLPNEFRFKLVSHPSLSLSNKIDSFKCEYFHTVNTNNQLDLYIDLDNYIMKKPLEINVPKFLSLKTQDLLGTTNPSANTTASSTSSPSVNEYTQTVNTITLKRYIHFSDTIDKYAKNRPLYLTARIILHTSSNPLSTMKTCPIQVYISASYCFFNLTGLPIIFKQASCKEAAGQSDEHEIARNNQALLFSFNDNDAPYACSMRIGKGCNDFKKFLFNNSNNLLTYRDDGVDVPNENQIIPKWCKPFSIESGSSFRALHVVNNTINNTNKDSKTSSGAYLNPDFVYYIGIEVKKGDF